MNTTIPPGLLDLLPSLGVDVDAFKAGYEALPVNKFTPQEWKDAVEGLLTKLGATIADPAQLWAAISRALVAGYDPKHGGLA